MFDIFVLCLLGTFLTILFLLGKYNPKNTASREVIKIAQKKEADNDKDNKTLTDMVNYHKNNPTIRYKL